MKKTLNLISIALLSFSFGLNAQTIDLTKPIVGADVVFNEVDGMVAIEGEHFYKQTNAEIRQWHITSKDNVPQVLPDPDGEHIANASGNAYIELLPDSRMKHADKLFKFENLKNDSVKLANFTELAGAIAVVYYKVQINNPGRYYVWVRTQSTNSEDNGVHVGFNDTWPETGRRMQWCDGKNAWTWGSKQRTEANHCGEPKLIYLDLKTTGLYDIQFSMREDGFEIDKFILTNDSDYIPQDQGIAVNVLKGQMPNPFEKVEVIATATVLQATPEAIMPSNLSYIEQVGKTNTANKVWLAKDFPIEGTKFYADKYWYAINPVKDKEAQTSATFPFETGTYDMLFLGVGENDGGSTFSILLNDKLIGEYKTPISAATVEESIKYNKLFENIEIQKGAKVTVKSKTGSVYGQDYSRGRWGGIIFAPKGKGAEVIEKSKSIITTENSDKPLVSKDGDGKVAFTGELKQWHKVTLNLNGPFAAETDKSPNPYSDYRMTVTFTHESGSPVYQVPAYFATDGNAGETGATEGNIWKAHLSPDKVGKWSYKISFVKGAMVAASDMPWMKTVTPYNGIEGSFEIGATDKTGRDFRSKGRLQYVGKNHLQFAGNGEYFFKAGPDAPETLLGYEDFDNTIAMKPNIPLKKFTPHLADYKAGDPTWKDGKGKGLIGAINYLASKGVNTMSFLTYNAAGDGDNVWPFVSRNEKFNYDCSKLDQWQIVFDYAQKQGLHLHFKTQETENDDNRGSKGNTVLIPASLDGGELGPERRIYYRELIARFGYLLALNWNLGEENTQTTQEQKEMAEYFFQNDPYHHNVVLHTYPGPQVHDKVYTPLLGNESKLTGASLQNKWDITFKQTLKWVTESNKANKPWVVANDEQGGADAGAVPDNGYKGFDPATTKYDLHDVRKQTLWGNLMAGGAGVEYYFGYKLPENDLLMQDYRSRDMSWDYCRIVINFLKEQKIPFQEMKNADALVGNLDMNKDKHCLAKADEIYLVQLAYVATSSLDLTNATGDFSIEWFNPVLGGKLQKGSVKSTKGGKVVELGKAPKNEDHDWVVMVRKK